MTNVPSQGDPRLLSRQREFHPALLMEGRPSRIDPDRRRLLIMEFQNCVVGSAV
jgi:hypothetical protein